MRNFKNIFEYGFYLALAMCYHLLFLNEKKQVVVETKMTEITITDTIPMMDSGTFVGYNLQNVTTGSNNVLIGTSSRYLVREKKDSIKIESK